MTQLCNKNQANCIEVLFAMIMNKDLEVRYEKAQIQPSLIVNILQAAFPDYSTDDWGELFHEAVKSAKEFDNKELLKYVSRVQVAFLQNTY